MAGLTNALTYNLYLAAITNLAVVDTPTLVSGVATTNDPNFQAMIPNMLDYSELMIQRDLDLMALETSQTYALVSGNSLFQVPVSDFVTVRTIEANSAPLTPVSKEFIQNVYGSGATPGQPLYFAPYGGDQATAGQTSTNFLLGPPPSAAYGVTVTGTVRMPSLYLQATPTNAATGTTFISTWLPDLLVQASMQYVAEYQRNFLANSSDPQMPGAYMAAYQKLLAGAGVEEARKRFAASGWSAAAPAPVATAAR
jgi:hypothetical protein